MRIKELVKRAANYLLRPELDITTRITNIILLLGTLALPPCIIVSIFIHTSIDGIIAEAILTFIAVFLLWYINSQKRDQFPIAMSMAGLNMVVFPMLFFKTGGRTTGMVIWMFLGSVYSVFILKGVYRILAYVCNILAFAACILFGYYHPEYVMRIPEFDECFDIILAYVIVLLITGCVFRIQTKVYDKQKKELEAKEAELEKLNLELQKASAAKSNFLANMSHEIRTPINAVLGMDEMIIRDALDPVILNYAKDIDVAGKQLLSVINDVLDLSKIEAGRFDLSLGEYQILNVLYDCAKIEMGKARDKKLDLIFDVDNDLPKIMYGDEDRIRQTIINFISNGIKYTQKGSVKVLVGYEDIDDENVILKVYVSDTGVGVPLEKQPYLFDNYVRIGEDKNIEGTGLGLAISKQLIELMEGEIGVDSTYGEGSTFYFKIPQRVIDRTPSGEFSTDSDKNRGERKVHRQTFTAETATLLAVDDVLVNLNVVRLLLRETKIKIDLAESGAEALEYLKKKKYDIVLMDHIMPEMDGLETLRRIRKLENSENKDVPIIALTANAIAGADSYYKDAGFCDYITKPIRVNELERSLINNLPKEKVNIT